MASGGPVGTVPATSIPTTDLVELTHGLRSELLRRGEFLPPEWVEDAAEDLHRGALVGWCLPGDGAGLGFYSRRAHRAYAHVHLGPGADPARRAELLLTTIVTALPAEIQRADAGVTGLSESEEGELARRLGTVPGFSTLERVAMNRSLSEQLPAAPTLPSGVRGTPARSISIDALAQLDWAGYHGTPDESLVSETVEQDRHEIEEILGGRLGRFLDEASAVLLDSDERAVGMLLAAEQSPHRAIILNVVVHPASRHRGLGRLLLRFALRASAALGYQEVRLWVTLTNLPARSLYESEGFRRGIRALIYRYDRSAADVGPHPQTPA